MHIIYTHVETHMHTQGFHICLALEAVMDDLKQNNNISSPTKQEYKTGRKTESESRKNESRGGRDSESERSFQNEQPYCIKAKTVKL